MKEKLYAQRKELTKVLSEFIVMLSGFALFIGAVTIFLYRCEVVSKSVGLFGAWLVFVSLFILSVAIMLFFSMGLVSQFRVILKTFKGILKN